MTVSKTELLHHAANDPTALFLIQVPVLRQLYFDFEQRSHVFYRNRHKHADVTLVKTNHHKAGNKATALRVNSTKFVDVVMFSLSNEENLKSPFETCSILTR